MLENNPHKRVTEGQLKREHENEIRASITKHLDLLEAYGREHHFQAYAPDLSTDPSDDTAIISWGIDTDMAEAFNHTVKFNELYGEQLPRLRVMFLGNVNL